MSSPFLHKSTKPMLVKEVATIKPLTPQQQRIKSLQTQKDNLGKQIKAERARERIAKAQRGLAKAMFRQ